MTRFFFHHLRRPTWKVPYFDLNLLKAIKAAKPGEPVYTRSRASTIIPAFVGAKIMIHNGMIYVPMIIQEEFVGRKLGVLVKTTKDHPPWEEIKKAKMLKAKKK